MEDLEFNIRRAMSDITKFDSRNGLFPGRAFVNSASHSHHIYLAINTIPIYNFFPKLEERFPSIELNFIQKEDDLLSKT